MIAKQRASAVFSPLAKFFRKRSAAVVKIALCGLDSHVIEAILAMRERELELEDKLCPPLVA